ncbi:ARM repeat-containing protein [Crepidotus variabilis]|uniref:ARM repeat-containing protein n=1 Tax=Crepidotus variabilis TaxID=179855 RepID=A0A9P6ELF6_9AGAR|nr:ARM repeat-containing protein [Crepidotus variabilis]
MTSEVNHDFLNQLLKKAQMPSQHNLSLGDLKLLASAFLPTGAEAPSLRPKAYVVLSAICQGARSSQKKEKDENAATHLLVQIFAPLVVQLFGETDHVSLLTGAAFLTALFQVDPQSATSIFVRDGLVENVTDSVELSPSPELSIEITHLLGLACGHKACRAVISTQIVQWLDFTTQQTTEPALQIASSLALIKLSKGAASDPPENGTPNVPAGRMYSLAITMCEAITSRETESCLDAVEGLAYLSTDPVLKDQFAKNPPFLTELFGLVPTKKMAVQKGDTNTSLIYGVVAIIYNLISYRPRLNEEQEQMEKLKRMAKVAPPQSNNEASTLDDDEHVKARIGLLITAGVLPVFAAAITFTDSAGIRQNAARSILCIVEEKENRGKVLQAGGAKVLQAVIKQSLSASNSGAKSSMPSISSQELDAFQALAKLSITSSPVQVFGPNIGAIYDVIRPFSILLQHPSSNLLQRFETVMALTNLASHSPDIASRIAKADGLVDKVELLLLEDHVLMRRASVELLCNLIAGSDEIFDRYSGDSPNVASKLHIFLALSDVEDVPTRLAASGALATLSPAPNVCKALTKLQFDKHRFFPIITQLLDPTSLVDTEDAIMDTNPGLVHRAAVCIANVFGNTKDKAIRDIISREAKACGLVEALIRVAKGEGVTKDAPILHQATQALKLLKE